MPKHRARSASGQTVVAAWYSGHGSIKACLDAMCASIPYSGRRGPDADRHGMAPNTNRLKPKSLTKKRIANSYNFYLCCMNDFLPLFPLKLVAFPGERLNLHIFEPRYKQLFRECQENQITFGIPAFLNEKIMDIGTELKLEKIEKTYDNGSLDVRTVGIGIFRIEEYYSQAPNKLYAGADITRLDHEAGDVSPDARENIFVYLEKLYGILSIEKKKMPKNAQSIVSYDIAHHVGFSVEQEYALLRIESEQARLEYIHMQLQKIVPVAKEMENLKERARLNGHFKKIVPPNV